MLHEEKIIEEFRKAMADHGIVVTGDIIADGKFHRIHVEGDRKLSRNGFYVLHIDAKPAGAFGCNKRFGNEQKFTWTSKATKPLSPEERRAFRERMERQRAEREAQERAKREDAARHARFMWDQAQECTDHPYLTRKGVKSHGLRVGAWEKIDHENGTVDVLSEQALLIPIRDTKKNIHSLQAIFVGKIYGDRDKDFVSGGAKAGLFYSFGKPMSVDVGGQQRQVIMVGEGYATLASAHECTGHAAIVAFDAGNLLAVARVLRERFPEAVLLFLADNDQWTGPTPENPHTPENPGLTKAREAAKAVGGLVAVPPFSHGEPGKPTDFNDLHKLRGADAVRQVIEAALNPPAAPAEPEPADEVPPWEDAPGDAPSAPLAAPLPGPSGGADDDEDDDLPEKNGYFAILGYNRGVYYIFQHGKRQIAEITKGNMSEIGLIEIAPLNWWEMNFPGARSSIDTKAAAEFIIRTAEKRGIYDPSKVRGRGAWVDADRIVYHHGDYLTVDGQPTDVTRIDSRYVYELDRSLPSPADTAMTCEEGRMLLDVAGVFRWATPGSAALLAGWVALAPMCGALKWRPHIWLTGGAGCGKSSVLNRYAHHLIKDIDLYVQGNTSEAGIRQELRSDARPVLFDESESNEEGDARRVQNVLSMIRQASTDSDAKTIKGTVGGSALNYHIRSMFCLASIQVAIKQQADVDRLTVLRLRPRREEKDASAGWARISEALWKVERDPELPARLFRRALDLLPTTLKNIDVFARAAAKKFNSQREGDQLGTLMAGAWSLISRNVATPEQALEMIEGYEWEDMRDNHDTDEAQRALGALMEAHVRIKGGGELTVYELVCAASGRQSQMADINDVTADALLQRYGMRVKDGWLVLANNSNELKRLMAGTSFEADYRGVLLRVDGTDKNANAPMKFNGVQSKCIRIPLEPIIGDLVARGHNEPAF